MIPDRVKAIIREVAAEHGFEARDILGNGRLPALVQARWEAMRQVRALKSAKGQPPSIFRMARWFNRSPEGVRYALRHENVAATIVAPNWYDHRARLAWLYGDADARIAANAPDVAAWNALGERKSREARG